jgi:hypothetical protein
LAVFLVLSAHFASASDPATAPLAGPGGKSPLPAFPTTAPANGMSATVSTPAQVPPYWAWAKTPPMGWNSYDAFGDSVTEAEVLANAQYMKDHLLSHGWQYCVVDFRWYDPGSDGMDLKKRIGAALTEDAYGRLQPAPNRFPSAAGGKGFAPLAAKIHAMGLKFGIHVMRGIPREAVAANLPIEGSTFHAADAANQASKCAWCWDMFGVRGDTPAGRAYYDSIIRLYASWGVDFVKIDDLSQPYSAAEIEALRAAIDACGRPIVFSTSPGETPIARGAHIATHANMWRMSGDFWDHWKQLDRAFVLLDRWKGYAGPGHWPDEDMIPLGKVGIRCIAAGKAHFTHFTKDEQRLLMSFWALAPSPLMLGMNLPDNDDATLAFLTNDAVLAIDQDPAGNQAVRVSRGGGMDAWAKDLANGDKAVGLFNRGKKDGTITFNLADAGMTGNYTATDVWSGKQIGAFDTTIQLPVPTHGAVLLRLKKQ